MLLPEVVTVLKEKPNLTKTNHCGIFYDTTLSKCHEYLLEYYRNIAIALLIM